MQRLLINTLNIMKKLFSLLILFSMSVTCWAQASVETLGDVNADRIVDVDDVSAIINIILGKSQITDYSGTADVTRDNNIDIDDVNKIINYVLNIEPPVTMYHVNGVAFCMVKVDGGTYMMGATENQLDYAYDDEKPAHQVTVSDFSIGQTPVTQELWMAIMGSNPSNFSSNHGLEDDFQRPVESINWHEATAFLAEINRLTGAAFRLPTEAEWEFAARGGNKSQGYIYAGSDDFYEVGWNYANTNYCTQPVASKKSNELGIYDMSGNVWEWCNDWYDKNYYSNSPSVNPQGPETGTYKSTRGGSIVNASTLSRVSQRDWIDLDGHYTTQGIRLAQ